MDYRHVPGLNSAGPLKALPADDLGDHQPAIADRFLDFLGGRIHLDSLLLRNESSTHISAELLVIWRSPYLFDSFLGLELKSPHTLSL
jgi:hypothetical protein